MIATIDLKVSMTELEASKAAVITDKDAVYDTLKQELTFKANRATGAMWRLVYDGKKVLAIIEGTAGTATTTIHAVEEFETEKQVFDRIKVLGLEYTLEQDDNEH